MIKHKSFLLQHLFSFIFIFLVIIGLLLTKFDLFPQFISFDEMQSFYLDYGLILLFLVTLIEGFLFLGVYWFGGVIMFFAILFSSSLVETISIIIVVWLALIIDSIINYLIGFYIAKFNFKNKYVNKDFNKKKFKPIDLLFLFHTTSIAYYCFNLGYYKRKFSILILVNFFVLLVCILYATLISVLV